MDILVMIEVKSKDDELIKRIEEILSTIAKEKNPEPYVWSSKIPETVFTMISIVVNKITNRDCWNIVSDISLNLRSDQNKEISEVFYSFSVMDSTEEKKGKTKK